MHLIASTFLAAALAAPGGGAVGGECPEGTISQVLVQNHSIFDPEAVPDEGPSRWIYRVTDSVHMQTREDFIRRELLFQEGDCYDEDLILETGRILRTFRFLARAEVLGVPQPDGSVHVLVVTQDEWTTKLSVRIRVEGGLRFEGLSLVEENLLGRGITAGAFHLDRGERRNTGLLGEVPRIRGTGWDVIGSIERSRIGSGVEQEIVHPFLGELGRNAFRQRIARTRTLFAYNLPEDAPYSHLVIPLVTERAELSAARRWGVPGQLLILGGGFSYERVGPGTVDRVEGIRDSDFSDRTPVGEDLASPVLPHLQSRQALRLNLVAGARNLGFRLARGLDAVDGVQDLPAGQELLVTLGRSIGATGPDRPGDLFGRLDLRAGSVQAGNASYLTLSMEGRRVDGRENIVGRWGDFLAEAHAFHYMQPDRMLARTLVFRATSQGGWSTTSPFQLTLGGPDGVRGYLESELPVGRKVVLTMENRGKFPGPLLGLVDLGFTVFGDLGAGSAGDTPFAEVTGWRGTLGAGLRFGFPPGSSTVIRADLAFPVGTDAGSRGAVFRIAAREWIGILNEFRSAQLARSRRSGITGEYIGAARDRPVP